jgi:hypothetical protein
MCIGTSCSSSESLLLSQAHDRVVGGTERPEKADIIFFLENNHREKGHLKWVADLIQVLNTERKSKGLYEYSIKAIPPILTSLPFPWEMWGDSAEIKEAQLRFKRLFEIENAVLDLAYSRPVSQIEQNVNCIESLLTKAAIIKMKPDIEVNDLTLWLKNPGDCKSKISEAGKALLPVIEKVKNAIIHAQVLESFPIQQTALINRIRELSPKYKIYVICGSNHAHPSHSQLPSEAARLLNSLGKTRYCIIDASGA